MIAVVVDGVMVRSSVARLAALAAGALLVACAAISPPPRAPVPFDLIGRVAVSYDGRSFFSNVRWNHLPAGDEIWLLTPAGQTLARIVSNEDGATLTTADHHEYSSSDVESLTRQALGWGLPLSHLGWWVQGEVAPGSAAQDVHQDARSRVVEFRQDGWQVNLTWNGGGEGRALPRRVGAASGTHTIRLVIDRWRTTDGS